MDFSPPPSHSSSRWCVLWAFRIGSFWQGERQGRPGDSLGVEGRGPCICSPLRLFALPPPLQSFLQAPFPAAVLSGYDFYLELGVVVDFPLVTGAPPFAPSFSFLLLCLWIGLNELGRKKKSNESENLRSE